MSGSVLPGCRRKGTVVRMSGKQMYYIDGNLHFPMTLHDSEVGWINSGCRLGDFMPLKTSCFSLEMTDCRDGATAGCLPG